MILIPAGRFQMGSPASEPERDGDERQHQVTISEPFALSVHETTFDEYERFARATGRQYPNDEGWDRGQGPVINVSWNDSQAYAQWLSNQTGREYRLPTEAEWEYAARAGTSSAYSFGSDEAALGQHAWYRANSGFKTHPVGQRKSNGWGLYDMHGNVWEWVQDWYGPYRASLVTVTDPAGPRKGVMRVLRGGSWINGGRNLRSADRFASAPGLRNHTFGFRLARGQTGSK